MAGKPPHKPGPPPPKGGKLGAAKKPATKKKSKLKDFGGHKLLDLDEYAAHAEEVKKLQRGSDFVDRTGGERERRPAAFDRHELGVVRSWVKRRPLEPTSPAAALIEFPRLWNTKRGRYSHFRTPGGAKAYAILRARPTY